MRKRKKIRDLLYISGEHQTKCFYSYGIEFREFMNCVPNSPENLLLLKHSFHHAQWNQHSGFEYVTKQNLHDLIEDDVYGYGDFCWVDFSNEQDLDGLTDKQIAELLFFAHRAKPLNQIPMRRFAYYAHDDGWFNKLYVTELDDYKNLLARVIALKLQKLTGRKFHDIPIELSSVLLECTRDGLFIDLSRVIKSTTELKIPITAIGHYTDMDKVNDFREEIKDYKAWLVYSKKSWKLIKEDYLSD
ncbi:peptide ABC transporter permease [Cohnella pontilimi]|uniref:Peptide ABC transporter permease n=1 Tax=Cohnella pontilimi TaxID=2564100 RepID=A0A4U0FB42_9BACL|nr:peptide ABC transporter permease [Cohnella pontilimi]TJY41995.1 peptide ABC transporter permease [Cohnella pontilimi]